jgi:hypothetical protein
VIHADHVLLDDRALVQLAGHVVAGGADQLHAPGVGLVVGLGADEAGQEAVVDVDDLPRVVLAQLGRQDLHVAGQHHHVAFGFAEQLRHLGVGGGLVVRRHRHVVEGDAVPLHEAAEGFVVGDDAGDLDVQLVGLPARQQVVQAVLLLGHQDHHALLAGAVADAPVHLELGGDGGELVAQGLDAEGQRVGQDLLAHEEAAGLGVGVVVGLGDPALVLGQEAAHGGDDADPIGAGQGQGVTTTRWHAFNSAGKVHVENYFCTWCISP